MRMCDPNGSIFTTTTEIDTIERLRSAGWREAPAAQEKTPASPERAIEVPTVECIEQHPLKYKGRYLSWYVQSGSVQQLRDVLRYLGVAFPAKALKKELQAILKVRIKEWKTTVKGEP